MTKLLAGLALAAAVTAAGCGGGGGGALSKSDFIKQADAICADAHKKEAAVTIPQVNQNASKDDLKKFGDAIAQDAKIERDQVVQLKKLTPPKDFQAAYTKALGDLSTSLDDVDKAVAAASNGDTATIGSALGEAQTIVTGANAVATNYGLKVCGSNS